MKGFIGAANIDTNSRLCMASSVAGHRRAFGADTVPGTYEDLEEADLVVLVGSNLAWCHPVLYQRLAAAKAARPAMQVVTVDPRRTATCDLADLHLAARARHRRRALQRAPRRDRPPRRRSTPPTSPPTSRASTPPSPRPQADRPRRRPASTPADLAAFLDLWIGTEKVVTVFSQGVNQSASGTDKVNAIINCHLATGPHRPPRHGAVLASPASRTPWAAARSAASPTCSPPISTSRTRPTASSSASSGTRPRSPEKPGLKAVDLFRACGRRRDRGALDPRHQPRRLACPRPTPSPRRSRRVPLVVVSDMFATHRHRAARPRPPPRPRLGREVRHRHQLRAPHLPPARLPRRRRARRGPTGGRSPRSAAASATPHAFAYADPGRDLPRARRPLRRSPPPQGRDFDIAALADADYDAMPPAQWPVGGPARFFADGGFFTPDGRGRMIPVAQAAAATRAPRCPLTLNTGRVRDQWHTMTRTGRAARLGQHIAEPFAEIHPRRRRGPRHRPRRPRRGDEPARPRPRPRPRHRPRAARAPSSCRCTGRASSPRAARVDALVPAVTDPHSGQPALKTGRGRGPPPRRRLARLRRLPRAARRRPPTTGRVAPHALRLARRARRRRRARRLGRPSPAALFAAPRRRGRRSSRTAPAAPPASRWSRTAASSPRSSPPASRSRSPAPTSSPPSRPTPRRRSSPAAPARRRRTAAPSSAPASTSASTPSSAPSPAARRRASRRSAPCLKAGSNCGSCRPELRRSSPPTPRSSPPSEPLALRAATARASLPAVTHSPEVRSSASRFTWTSISLAEVRVSKVYLGPL